MFADVRSVVLNNTPRCGRCRLPPRWCVCAGQKGVQCDLEIDVLTHHREWFRPSSTSHLIQRVMPAARQHLWRRERPIDPASIRKPGRELWVLHPHGAPMPAGAAATKVQVVLLDGAWRETSAMAQGMGAWGRLVSLPMAGESRYWLRAQADVSRFSTIEALLWMMQALGCQEAHDDLRAQFELHVYANLRARGFKELAAEFLKSSPVPACFPEMLAQLHTRRPNDEAAQPWSAAGPLAPPVSNPAGRPPTPPVAAPP